MTKNQAIELLPAIKHFAEGGNLYYYSMVDRKWYAQDVVIISGGASELCNVIEDKHFEGRKSFALGEKVEARRLDIEGQTFYDAITPTWDNKYEYRPKPKDIHEWYCMTKLHDGSYTGIGYFTARDIELRNMFRYEPSKRIKQ